MLNTSLKKSGYLSVLITFISISLFGQNTGSVMGIVRDAQTLKPLRGISFTVTGTEFTAISDSMGAYQLKNLPTKTYNLKASGVGYEPMEKFDVQVISGNMLELNFDLEPSFKRLQTIEVKSAFLKPSGVVNSVHSLGMTEIAKYPGANFDIAKVVQSFPGVSGSVGFRNDVIIRGGAPNENVYFLDGIELPSINHFATQGAAGGPAGILNVSFIENVTLHTSAFPAKYDNPLSGVLQFKQRTGNASRFQSNVRMSATEFALTGEGPLGKKNGKTTFIGSVRRSYLQLLFDLIDLPFLPDYWDYQYKLTHKPNQNNEINLIAIGAIDNFRLNEPDNPTLEQQSILDRIPVNKQRTNTVGFSWRHTLPKGYWLLAISKNRMKNIADKFEDNNPDSGRIFQYSSIEDETRLRYEWNTKLGDWNLSSGTSVVYAQYENSTFQRRAGYKAEYASDIDFLKYGLFFQANRRWFDNRLLFSFGLRADGNSFTENGNQLQKTISPRASLAYKLSDRWNWNASVGRYYKIAPYTILGYRENGILVNKDIDYISSDHVVTGLEWNPDASSRFTLEGFHKWYGHYPLSLDRGISLANLGGDFGILGNENVSTTGKGKSYGLEFMYQKRLTKHLYGIMAYTFYRSMFTDTNNRYINSAWDYRHLVSFTGGYKFGRNWELGIRFRYQGRAPYTPYDTALSKQYYLFTGEAVSDFSRTNTLFLRAFNAADIRIDKKWNFKKWTLDLYLDIQNCYKSKNPSRPDFTLKRNADNSIATYSGAPYQPGSFSDPSLPNNRADAIPVLLTNETGTLLPTIGFEIGF